MPDHILLCPHLTKKEEVLWYAFLQGHQSYWMRTHLVTSFNLNDLLKDPSPIWKGHRHLVHYRLVGQALRSQVASQVAQWVKNRPAVQETQETRFDPWVGNIRWRRAWQFTPIPLPGESHGQRNLAGYSPWGRRGSDTTEWLSTQDFCYCFALCVTLSYIQGRL